MTGRWSKDSCKCGPGLCHTRAPRPVLATDGCGFLPHRKVKPSCPAYVKMGAGPLEGVAVPEDVQHGCWDAMLPIIVLTSSSGTRFDVWAPPDCVPCKEKQGDHISRPWHQTTNNLIQSKPGILQLPCGLQCVPNPVTMYQHQTHIRCHIP